MSLSPGQSGTDSVCLYCWPCMAAALSFRARGVAVSARVAAFLQLSDLPLLQRQIAGRFSWSGQAACRHCFRGKAPGFEAIRFHVCTRMWHLQHPALWPILVCAGLQLLRYGTLSAVRSCFSKTALMHIAVLACRAVDLAPGGRGPAPKAPGPAQPTKIVQQDQAHSPTDVQRH